MSGHCSRVLAAIEAHVQHTPDKPALEDGTGHATSYAQLNTEIRRIGGELRVSAPTAVGLLMDNTPAWAVADLALVHAQLPCVPVPLFFSPQQMVHLISSAGIELLLTDQPHAVKALLAEAGFSYTAPSELDIAGSRISLFRLKSPNAGASAEETVEKIPDAIAKITFTSGTTGDPKGVCLTQQTMDTVAASLREACAANADDRHVCALPLATLLENIGGLYVPLLAGSTCILPGLAAVGMRGAAGLDPQRFLAALMQYRASTCILIPQMLLALIAAVQGSGQKPGSLRYLAVGGAPVSLTQLQQAAALGLPVFEGYGLSEAGSVVAVNSPQAMRPGTVGKPLPHVRTAFAEDGEILVAGALFDGYLGQPLPDFHDGYYATGDIGHLDDDGFLHITGRKKHIFITAFGRNVSPEWVERELTITPGIAQAVVFGEARPFNVAVLVARDGVERVLVEQCVASANNGLPDYARVSRWLLAESPFTVANGLYTGTGRPRRDAIWRKYREQIESIYQEPADGSAK